MHFPLFLLIFLKSCVTMKKTESGKKSMQQNDFIIRPLQQNDKEQMQKFFDDMGEESASFFNVNHGNEKRTMEFFINGKKDHLFWVLQATENNQPVIAGLVFIWGKDTSVVWLGIAIRDSFQGKHLGQELLSFVFDYCKEHDHGGILLSTAATNHRAQKLYERCGFEKIGKSPTEELLYIKRFQRGEQ